jgi:hypothetical protein
VSSEPVEIAYTYTRSEYIRAMRRHYKRIIHVYRDTVLAVVMIVASGLMMYFSAADRIVALVVMMLGLILLSMVVYALLILYQLERLRREIRGVLLS